jgi:hypothetical protein
MGRNNGVSVTASDYQRLKRQITGLKETIAELKRDNGEKAKINAGQAKLIEREMPSKGHIRRGSTCISDIVEIINKVRAAAWNYMDETGIRVLSKNYWLWTFRTPEDKVVVVIRPSMGRTFRVIFSVGILAVPVLSMAGEPILSSLFYSAAGRT